jgi:hypothetical protein
VCRVGRRSLVMLGLFSLFFGLVLLRCFRQRLDKWRIGVELRAGASPSALLAVFTAVPFDALELGDT